jgi:hypothetical protein
MRVVKPLLFLVILCIAPALALAQDNCPQIVDKALAAADQFCQNVGRNQACYGNFNLTAEPQPGVNNFTFSKVGDIVNVSALRSMTLSPMDTSQGAWGVALLRLQANLPDTIPGQNVTFLLFGDVQITNAVAPTDTTQHPMQAFTLRTGIGDAKCDQAPESGLLVQTPQGADEITLNVNGVDVSMGSTVLFQADADQGMSVSTLEGAAFVAAQDDVQPIVPGSWVHIALDKQLRASASPELPKSYVKRVRLLQSLPLRLLQRKITAAPPLTPDQINLVVQRIQNGQLPCGEAPFPPCAKFARFIQHRIEICEALPRAKRPPFCARLRRFVNNVLILAATAAAETAVPEITPAVAPTDTPSPGS